MPDRRRVNVAGDIINLAVNNDGSVNYFVLAGTAFPGSPTNYELFYRTDLSQMYIWSGSAWILIGPIPSQVDHGTSFPPSPSSGLLWFRDDLQELYEYNGTAWVLIGPSGGGASSRQHMTYTGTAHVTKTTNADTSILLTTDMTVYGLEADQSPFAMGGGVGSIVLSMMGKRTGAANEVCGLVIEPAGASGGYVLFFDPTSHNAYLYRYTTSVLTSTGGTFTSLVNWANNIGGSTPVPFYMEFHVTILSSSIVTFEMRLADGLRAYVDSSALDLTGTVHFGRYCFGNSTAFGETCLKGTMYSYPDETP